MTKYRGADGWIHDDGVTRRYHNRDDTKPEKAAEKAAERAADDTKPERPKLTTCPNCPFSIKWRREEGYCDHCGWGKTQGDWDNWKPPVTAGGGGGDGALACCGMVGVAIIACLVGMGMGYGIGGWGGLLVGLGLGITVPVAFIFVMLASTSKKEPPNASA